MIKKWLKKEGERFFKQRMRTEDSEKKGREGTRDNITTSQMVEKKGEVNDERKKKRKIMIWHVVNGWESETPSEVNGNRGKSYSLESLNVAIGNECK